MEPLCVLLLLSVTLSSGRNLLSKSISGASFGEKSFFLYQGALFFYGAGILLLFNIGSPLAISPLTLIYAVIYGGLLLLAQWCYTAALKQGNTAICATVYSLGFIFPTLSGMVFWSEAVTFPKMLGILIVIPTLILSGIGNRTKETKSKNANFIFPLAVAMLSSGGWASCKRYNKSHPTPNSAPPLF